MAVKVLYEGRSLASVDVNATYAGFSDQPHTFAYSTKTDANGVAKIRIMEKGDWFVNVVHEVPYPDIEECEKYKYNYLLTFKIK